MHSYHIFYFPFRWSLPNDEQEIFSRQVDLSRIPIPPFSMWERVQLDPKAPIHPSSKREEQEAQELFSERQYYFDFVHPVLYDMQGSANPLLHHYERREPKDRTVEYLIQVKEKTYRLRVDALNLNLYSTGVGILSFYLANEAEGQEKPECILAINQFGRRIMPPHCGEFNPDGSGLLASSISIQGLEEEQENRYEDHFDYQTQPKGDERGLHTIWQPARFIRHLINDLSPELQAVPVIDDRMLVNCWYGNQELSEEAQNEGADETSKFIQGNFWYKYIFVDTGNQPEDDTCQNDRMKSELLKMSTYFRWQKKGTLYGVSRYSLVALTDRSVFSTYVLAMHMRTIYSRMFELIIIQRASMLRFSGEVTKVSGLRGTDKRDVACRIGSLYKEYIRFVNQIYFRNVTVQDQGIELYEALMKQFASYDQIKDLDDEIEELHQYITLLVDQNRNENGEKLNLLAAIFLPATLLTGLFGMNQFCDLEGTPEFWIHTALIGIVSIISFIWIKKWRK